MGRDVNVRKRMYQHDQDYDAVGNFLTRTYRADPPRNWLQPRWVYAHAHPALEKEHLGKFAIWEEEDEIVAVAHYEHKLGINYVQLDPRYPQLKRQVLEYVAEHLVGDLKPGRGCCVYIDEDDADLSIMAVELGFVPEPESAEPLSRYVIPEPFPEIRLPEGFHVQSLADGFDVEKVHRVMHRGFNHDGEPPADELEDRRRKLSVPELRRDLTVIAVAPDGTYASFCGMWPVPGTTACYIEPVATDPDYRRMGLGTAVVMESIRRCAAEGATIAYVGSDQPFYLSMGFEVCGNSMAWWRPEKPSP
jgi:predicted N-acetyltransferase YhbS